MHRGEMGNNTPCESPMIWAVAEYDSVEMDGGGILGWRHLVVA